MRTLEEWFVWYEEKSGDTIDRLKEKAFTTLYDAEKGFIIMGFTKELCFIEAVAGDYEHWLDIAEAEAMQRNVKYIAGKARMRTNPKAFLRRLAKRGVQRMQLDERILYKKVGDSE